MYTNIDITYTYFHHFTFPVLFSICCFAIWFFSLTFALCCGHFSIPINTPLLPKVCMYYSFLNEPLVIKLICLQFIVIRKVPKVFSILIKCLKVVLLVQKMCICHIWIHSDTLTSTTEKPKLHGHQRHCVLNLMSPSRLHISFTGEEVWLQCFMGRKTLQGQYKSAIQLWQVL